MDIKTACTPRPDILSGIFNPEIFTVSLSVVTNHYQGINTGIHELYKDAALFFQDATYPTQGLKTILSDFVWSDKGKCRLVESGTERTL
ncbi:MAG: hypothetical protein K9K63_09440 [Desulfotignum sp.]|nr:hypothetical protein [Desulfotignum sp.]MCF8087633.1 hypothetical protein [Desulfotignum sp.]MCF8137520.1 hypothetical protein [Desulfotignum sp.]